MSDKIDAVIASMGWDLDPQEWADMRALCEAALAAQAPAAQEPAAWDVFYADDDRLAHTVRTKSEADRYSGMAYYVKPLHYTTPPAAEQPDTVNVPRKLADRLCHRDNYTRQMARRELRNILLGKEGEA